MPDTTRDEAAALSEGATKLTPAERRMLHEGVCRQHRDTAPGVFVCGPCEDAGDAAVERILAARIEAAKEEGERIEAVRRIIWSGEANLHRAEACCHVVEQPYADNRYVRLLDELREEVPRDGR